MARKSRKINKELSLCQNYKAAAYVRLSRETEQTRERETLNTQIDVITNFIGQKEEIDLIDIYIDDNYTGTNFDRPEYLRMMEDIKRGWINCIVVKDISRLGRDYLEVTKLLDQVFKEEGVRFIAINNNFDSLTDDVNITLHFTSIFDTFYAMDASKKTTATMEKKMEQGNYCSRPAYGYQRNPENRDELIIDPEPAKIVKKIFDMAANKISNREIADYLNKKKVLTPWQYRFRDRPEKLAEKPHLRWTKTCVQQILNNPIYVGTMILGKTRTRLYKREKKHSIPKDEWKVFENHHVPIVSKDLFDLAHNRIDQAGKRRMKEISDFPLRKDDLLRKKIVCGRCGCVMSSHSAYGGRIYECSRKKTYGSYICPVTPVKMQMVNDIILDTLQKYIRLFVREEELDDACLKKKEQSVEIYRRKISASKKRIVEIVNLKKELYFDFKSGLIGQEEFDLINRKYTSDICSIQKKILEQQQECQEYNSMIKKGLLDTMCKYLDMDSLSQDMVDEFVTKVSIFENKKIEIEFSFQDELKVYEKKMR